MLDRLDILFYDPVPTSARSSRIEKIVNGMPSDVHLTATLTEDAAKRELLRPYAAYIIHAVTPYQILSLMLRNPRIDGPVVVLAAQPDLESLLQDVNDHTMDDAVTLLATAQTRQLIYVRRDRHYLEKGDESRFSLAVLNAIERARVQQLQKFNEADVDFLPHWITASKHKFSDPRFLASLSFTLYTLAHKMKGEIDSEPAAGSDPAEREQARAIMKKLFQNADRLMIDALAHPGIGERDGKVPFTEQTSESGAVRFDLMLVKQGGGERADYLAKMYASLHTLPAHFRLNVPGPHPITRNYPIFRLGEDSRLVASAYIHGPTAYELVEERTRLTEPHLRNKGMLYCNELAKKVLHDMAVFEHVTPGFNLNAECSTREQRNHVVQMFLCRVIDSATELLKDKRLARIAEHLEACAFALRAADTSEPTALHDATIRVDERAFVPLFDRVLRNMSVRDTTSDARHASLKSVLQSIDKEAPKARDAQLRERYAQQLENLHHYDFEYRPAPQALWPHTSPLCTPSLIGEDFFKLMLDPAWAFHKDGISTDEALESNIYRYLIYKVIARRYRLEHEDPADPIVVQGNKLIAAIDEDGLHTRLFKSNTRSNVLDYLHENGGIDPQSYGDHFDWMRYCSAMRRAFVAHTKWRPTSSPQAIDALVLHYLDASSAPLEHLRQRAFRKAQRAGTLSTYYERGLTPFTHLNLDRALDDLSSAQKFEEDPQIESPKERTDLHLHRLDYLCALSRYLVRCMEADRT